jgi:hypothetical protein
MMQHSEALEKLAPALVKVQEAVGGVEKNSINPHFKSRYSDLAATNKACREALVTNGFSVSQWPGKYHAETREMEMTTFLLHASGQWMRETLTIPLGKVDAQGYGSCCTYARRYALQAALGLSPEDDDGNAASRGGASNDSNGHALVSPEDRDLLITLIEKSPMSAEEVNKAYGIASLDKLPASKVEKLRERLNELIIEEKEAV